MRRKRAALLLSLLIGSLLIITGGIVDVVKAHPIKVFVDPPAIRDTTLVPNTQFSIDITVDYIEEPWSYQFEMSFNPEVLQGVSVENGPFLGSGGGTVIVLGGLGFDNTEGSLSLFGAYLDPIANFPTGGMENPPAYGVLARVTFEVVGIGGSPLELGLNTMLVNKNGGNEFDGEIAAAEKPHPYLPIKIPNPGFLGHGYFDNRPEVEVNPAEVKGVPVNDSFTINIIILDIEDLYSLEFRLNWTTALLNVTGVAAGDFLGPTGEIIFYQEIHNEEGYIYVNCSRTVGSGVDGSGTVANVTFLVLGEGNSTLHLYDTSSLDSTSKSIAMGTVDGWFVNILTHDIAILGIATNPTKVEAGSGDPVFINVTVVNEGSYLEEDIGVTVYYDEDEIGNKTIQSLEKGAEETLRFMWNTTGVGRGKYRIRANATAVPGETDTADNTHPGGMVTISDHDIAITSVLSLKRNVDVGENVTLTVRIRNLGTEIETFNVTVYLDGNELDTRTVENLGYEAEMDLPFIWETTGVELGNYSISASATVVEGETNTDDNTYPGIGQEETLVTIEAAEGLPFPIELTALIAVVVVIFVPVILFSRRRKRPPVF